MRVSSRCYRISPKPSTPITEENPHPSGDSKMLRRPPSGAGGVTAVKPATDASVQFAVHAAAHHYRPGRMPPPKRPKSFPDLATGSRRPRIPAWAIERRRGISMYIPDSLSALPSSTSIVGAFFRIRPAHYKGDRRLYLEFQVIITKDNI